MLNSTVKSIITLFAAPVALTGIALPAAAQDDRPIAAVRYGDLDLTSAKGQERLQRRVDSAIARMCDTHAPQRQSLRERAASIKCRTVARRDAQGKMAALWDKDGLRLAGGSVVAVR